MSHGLFTDVLATLIVVISLLSMEGQRALRFHQNILICVPKMYEGLTVLERNEGN